MVHISTFDIIFGNEWILNSLVLMSDYTLEFVYNIPHFLIH